jgi:hypothetical protein
MAMNSLKTASIAIGLCLTGLIGHAQEISNINRQIDAIMATLPTIPKPSLELINRACEYADKNDLRSLRLFAQLSGADPVKDVPVVMIAKVRKMWATYFKELKCDNNIYLKSGDIEPRLVVSPNFTEIRMLNF